jgi:hypothetical protein
MSNKSKNFKNNRKKEFKEQFDYWSNNLESGVLRLLERILLGFNVSDILAGNLGQIQHLDEVKQQIKSRRLLQESVLQTPRDEMYGLPVEATSPQYLFEFKNAKVDVLTGLIVLDAGFVVDSTLAKWQKIIFRGGIGSSIKRTKRARFKLPGSYLVLPHSPFYYHTVIDELPNLIHIREHNQECKNVLVHALTPQWAIELLEFFEFTVTKLEKKAVIVENLFSVSAPRIVVKNNLDYLRRNIQKTPNRILIVSRKGAPRSDNSIESAILAKVPNSEIIDPGDFSISEQIKLFSEAKVIIGLHGGALTNAVWMDNSGKLVEVFNHAYRTSDYQRLCAELGISYVSVDALDLDDNQLALKVQKYVNE